MPFCPNCGGPFNNGEKFCMQCGKPIDENRRIVPLKDSQTKINSIIQQTQMRGESISEVVKMMDYFSCKQAQYDEYDDCDVRIGKCTQVMRKAPVVWGIILSFFGGFIPITLLIEFIKGNRDFVDQFFNNSENYPLFVIALVLFAIGVVLILVRIVKVVVRKKSLKKYIARESELAIELTDYYNSYGPCVIGAEFTNPRILELIGNVLRQGRADTIKEAINILLDDAHKTQMELNAQLTALSARQAAGGATAAAAFSAARFFIDGISLLL